MMIRSCSFILGFLVFGCNAYATGATASPPINIDSQAVQKYALTHNGSLPSPFGYTPTLDDTGKPILTAYTGNYIPVTFTCKDNIGCSHYNAIVTKTTVEIIDTSTKTTILKIEGRDVSGKYLKSIVQSYYNYAKSADVLNIPTSDINPAQISFNSYDSGHEPAFNKPLLTVLFDVKALQDASTNVLLTSADGVNQSYSAILDNPIMNSAGTTYALIGNGLIDNCGGGSARTTVSASKEQGESHENQVEIGFEVGVAFEIGGDFFGADAKSTISTSISSKTKTTTTIEDSTSQTLEESVTVNDPIQTGWAIYQSNGTVRIEAPHFANALNAFNKNPIYVQLGQNGLSDDGQQIGSYFPYDSNSLLDNTALITFKQGDCG